MLKPVRIIANDKIKRFSHGISANLEHNLQFITGEKVTLSPFEAFLMPIETYISAYKKKSILLKIFSDKDYQGELYWFFELKTSIVLGSMMRLLAPNVVEEKLKTSSFDEMDRDSFGEVGNQLCGILDRVFRDFTSKNIHLKMDFNKKVYPDENIQLSTFLAKEEYVVLISTIHIPKYESQKITLLLPRSLYEVMLNIELELEGIAPKLLLMYSHDLAFTESMQTKLNSRFTKLIRAENADDILHMAKAKNIQGIAVHLKEIQFPLSHQDTIFWHFHPGQGVRRFPEAGLNHQKVSKPGR